MDQRLKLQALLEGILGSRNVYFQPPSNVTMRYPAIRYELDSVDTKFAGNRPYIHKDRYQLTYIDRDPDEGHAMKQLKHLPSCTFARRFAADDLNHTVYTLYF